MRNLIKTSYQYHKLTNSLVWLVLLRYLTSQNGEDPNLTATEAWSYAHYYNLLVEITSCVFRF